ncbi:AbrB/MazE/SpoVT family DNA-binding domain-containing protein [Bacillus toyonensis]|uniref:AbrB/MazE/SpoVT family DNA-binding domain-containing protein n=1 Tax=Bacillus toyonensis TaxID=155322 RepID=UPI00270104C8|nr:AbrB/MazE/SpoVT family DNA-binding domain-containing protein [Bacillus toyonensis]MDO8159661.1 AbrB/MazE/SpoVT family DNA-binding domain-containing protein [Bacillus toyonensis]
MKNTGIVRRIDDLGRVVVPKELRNTLGLSEGTPLEIHVDGGNVVLKKQENICVVTGEVSETNIELFGGQIVVSKAGAKVLLDSLTQEVQRRGWVSR